MRFDRLREDTRVILDEVIDGAGGAALIGFPNHDNAGDSLISRGQQQYFRALGVRLNYVTDQHLYNADHLRRFAPTGPVLIQGGGNFGDRWPEHQNLRERVIEDFSDRHIIQLPQSIEFASERALLRCQAAIAGHPRFTLLVREHRATTEAQRLFPSARVMFCPDAALGARVSRGTRQSPTHDVTVLRRQDSESAWDGRLPLPGDVSRRERDWGLSGWRRLAATVLRAPGRVARDAPSLSRVLYPLISGTYERIADLNISAATRVVTGGKMVVTDRLHAVVLCTLLGVPVVGLDNANHKVRNLINDYLGALPDVQLAESPEEAALMVTARLSAQ